MASYSSFILGEFGTVRRTDHGITDAERELGVKIFHYDLRFESHVADALLDAGFEVLSADAWKELINNEGDLPNDLYIPAKIPFDKWDSQPIIY